MARIPYGYYNSGPPKAFALDPDYERLTGRPYERVEYWWPDRTWRRVKGIDLGKPAPLAVETTEPAPFVHPLVARVRQTLEDAGPLPVSEIAARTGDSPSLVEDALTSQPETFGIIGKCKRNGNQVLCWGLLGVHGVALKRSRATKMRGRVVDIRNYLLENGPATRTQIADHFHVSRHTIDAAMNRHRHLFVRVGIKRITFPQGGYTEAPIWGVVGVHTPPKEK